MLDVCLLGTAGMMPLPHRWLTAALMRYNGSNLLIDCGEGTQIAIKEKGWTFKPIDVICFTHYHADHISGLPGLLLTMGNAERTEPLTMIGPKGLEKVVSALRMIAPELPFEIRYIELTGPEEDMEINGYHIHAFKVNHNISCYGYTVEIRRAGRFDVERARDNHIPQKLWNPLQKGQTVTTEDGITFTPDMVLGAPRKGIKVTYCTDTRPTEQVFPSILIQLLRQFLLLIPFMWGLEKLLKITGIWLSFPVTETATFVLALLIFRAGRKKETLCSGTKTQ